MDRLITIKKFYTKYYEISKNFRPKDESEHLAVGWSSENSANDSYKTIASYKFQDWKKMKNILDIGSGLGNFLPFLRKENSFTGNYMGIEIIENFALSAQEQFLSDENSSFVYGDFLKYNFEDKIFDWSFSIGSLSIVQPNQQAEDILTIKKMCSLSKHGISVFLNDKSKFKKNNIARLIPPGNLIAAHNIEDFVEMLKTEIKNYKDIEIMQLNVNGVATPKTFIHVFF